MVAVQVVRLVTLLAVGASAYLFARAVGAARSAAAVSVVVLFVGTTYAGKLGVVPPRGDGVRARVPRRCAGQALDGRAAQRRSRARRGHAAGAERGARDRLAVRRVDRRRHRGRGHPVLAGAPERLPRRSAAWWSSLIGGWLVGNLALGGGLSGAGQDRRAAGTDGATDPTWRFADLVAGRIGRAGRPRPSTPTLPSAGSTAGSSPWAPGGTSSPQSSWSSSCSVIAWRGREPVRQGRT